MLSGYVEAVEVNIEAVSPPSFMHMTSGVTHQPGPERIMSPLSPSDLTANMNSDELYDASPDEIAAQGHFPQRIYQQEIEIEQVYNRESTPEREGYSESRHS